MYFCFKHYADPYSILCLLPSQIGLTEGLTNITELYEWVKNSFCMYCDLWTPLFNNLIVPFTAFLFQNNENSYAVELMA